MAEGVGSADGPTSTSSVAPSAASAPTFQPQATTVPSQSRPSPQVRPTEPAAPAAAGSAPSPAIAAGPKDLYRILNLQSTATEAEIKKSYKLLAVQLHPDRHVGDDSQDWEGKFKDVGEAYEILSHEEKRRTYDKLGYDALVQGKVYKANPPRDVFEAFFGEQNPFKEFGKAAAYGPPRPQPQPYAPTPAGYPPGYPYAPPYHPGGPYGYAPPQPHYPFQPPHPPSSGYPPGHGNPPPALEKKRLPPITKLLPCTLEELFAGTTKTIKHVRLVRKDGKLSPQERELEVNLGVGWKGGSTVTFPGEGDETPDAFPADLIVAVEEAPHPHFTRNLNDLIHKRKLTLAEAMCGASFMITLLDGAPLEVKCTPPTTPGTEKIFKGCGYISHSSRQRGDLRVHFEVAWPKAVTVETSDALKPLLVGLDYAT